MRKFLSTAVLSLLFALGLNAQNVSDLIISEALATPDSTGIMDNYGRRTGWVELYNKSTGTVNYGGCYLTDDRANLKKSPIPKSDLRTKLGPRQSVMLFCSGKRVDGTFYTGFTLENGKTIYLVSNDGRTIIDSLFIPESLPAGMSVIKLPKDIRQRDFQAQEHPAVPSPGLLNGDINAASKADAMAATDPHGWTLSIVSVSVVFSALALLWLMFWLLFDRPARKSAQKPAKKKDAASNEGEVAAAIALALDMENGGEVYAAISAAVHLYLSNAVHDVEPGIVTIVRKPSGWDNKALNFRKTPKV